MPDLAISKETLDEAIDRIRNEVVAPTLSTVNQQGASIVAELRATADRIEAMLKPFNEFIASVSIKAGK